MNQAGSFVALLRSCARFTFGGQQLRLWGDDLGRVIMGKGGRLGGRLVFSDGALYVAHRLPQTLARCADTATAEQQKEQQSE
jgi:hypothetical protein